MKKWLSPEKKAEIKETLKWTVILLTFTAWPLAVSIIRGLFNI